jgi:Tol biopolymer transport system component
VQRFPTYARVIYFLLRISSGFLNLILASCCIAQRNAPAPVFWIAFDRINSPEIRFASFPYVDVFLMDQTGHHSHALTSDHRSHNPSWSPDGKQIAFLREERAPLAMETSRLEYNDLMSYLDFLTIPRDVFRIDCDGKNSSLVAAAGPEAEDVTWFADGKRIGVRISDRTAGLALVDIPGGFFPSAQSGVPLNRFLRTGQPSINNSSWSYQDLLDWVPPVDNFLPILVVSRSNRTESLPKSIPSSADLGAALLVLSLDGTASPFSTLAYDISWSHNRKRIAYSQFSGDQKSILYSSAIRDDGTELNRRALTDPGLDAHGPAWSSDDSRIAFTGLWKDSSQIFIAAADGTKLVQLSREPKMSCYHVSWSPDGKWIVADCRENVTVMRPLTKEFGGLSNIFLFDVSKPGQKPRQLTKCTAEMPLPSPTCGARNPSFAPIQFGISRETRPDAIKN